MERVTVYHATPLCKTCDDELSKVQRASQKAGAEMQVKFSLWNRIKYGVRFLSMPVVVIDDRTFSVLGAFREESLIAELEKSEKRQPVTAR